MRQTDRMTLFLDGETVRVTGVSPSVTLLEYLRNTARTATKEGCAEGDCGACTVAVRGQDGAYRAVNSCLVPLGAVSNQEVVTAAGLAQGGELHPVQSLLAAAGGSQCGFCTPGFVMSLFAAQGSGERGDAVLEGNLCRCTGYGPIRAVLQSLPDADRSDSLYAPPKASVATSYSTGDSSFFHPQTLPETFEVLKSYPDAKLIAGGTDLGVELNKLLDRPAVMVSLAGVAELHGLRETAAGLELGAALTLSELETRLQGRVPLLETMLKQFAARQIRNRATLGGGLATASPVGDLAPVLLAYDAQVTLTAAAGERTVPLRHEPEGRKTSSSRRSARGAAPAADLTGPGAALLERLKAWRAATAKEAGLPAYVVFHDATLAEIAARRPASLAELGGVSGVGPAKLERYGEDLLAAVAAAAA